jgi:hypothetical protein
MTLPLLLALTIAVLLFYWVWVVAPRGIQAQREALLQAEGRATGAAFFPLDPRRMLGSWDGTCIVFDPGARKACIVVKGKTAHTVDFDYFRMWHLKWIEQFQGPLSPYLHVHFLFETSDFDRPTIRVNVSSKAEGDQWNAKLAILLQ